MFIILMKQVQLTGLIFADAVILFKNAVSYFRKIQIKIPTKKDYTDNYELRIMHYELFGTHRTHWEPGLAKMIVKVCLLLIETYVT